MDDKWGKEGESKVRLNQSLPVYAALVGTMGQAVSRVVASQKANGFTLGCVTTAPATKEPWEDAPIRYSPRKGDTHHVK